MKIYTGLRDSRIKKARRAIAIGIFDGLHRGHAAILQKAVRAAKVIRGRSLVITFEPHPQEVLAPHKGSLKFISSLEHRLRLFEREGLDEALVIRFDKKFARMGHGEFLERHLLERLGMAVLSVGHDFRFGKNAAGGHDYLKACSLEDDFKLFITEPKKDAGHIISSTRIRQLIEKGDLTLASRMLGRPVSLYGTVVHGKGRGKGLGFPTANLDPHHETLPPQGVYSATGTFSGRTLKSVVHIGARPTFGDKDKTVEVYFPGFRGDLYGREIELFFTKRLRGVRRFSSKEALARQIQKDLRKAGF